MIKKILFTAALLVPGLAYGQNPSADLSVQVVPAGSGIACDIGPNYTGTIPAGAQAAGFTHCAANYDFTTAFYGTLSNWLDCAGAASPQWWNIGYNSPATPCARYSIVNDSVAGSNVLHLLFTAADHVSSMMTWMATTNSSSSGAIQTNFPQGTYIEITFRSTTATINALGSPPPLFDILSIFSYVAPTTGNFLEWDLDESYTNASSQQCWHQTDGGANCTPSQFPNFNVYTTYGMRVTSNGSSQLAQCGYLDTAPTSGGTRTQLGCTSVNGQSGVFTRRNYWGTGVGTQNTLTGTVANDMEMFIKSIVIWECAGWKTGQCDGTVLTGAP